MKWKLKYIYLKVYVEDKINRNYGIYFIGVVIKLLCDLNVCEEMNISYVNFVMWNLGRILF